MFYFNYSCRTSTSNNATMDYNDSRFQVPHRRGDGRMSSHGTLLEP
jgi:hypothetical protein